MINGFLTLKYFSAVLATQPEVQVNVVQRPDPFFFLSKRSSKN